MKTKILLILMMWSVVGCKDFLEEVSQNEIRPATVKDMEKLLEGEAYWVDTDGSLFVDKTDIFTDNVTSKVVASAYVERKQQERYWYAWDNAMFDEVTGNQDISLWEIPYRYIKGCNVILEYIDGMSGDEVRREHIRGEAYMLRGFYYFYLVNFFGLPYTYGDPSQNLGVPLKLVSGVTDEKFTRNTVADCYGQIEKDLLLGTRLMSENRAEMSTQLNRVNYLVGFALLSRMYLYMGDWDAAIAYADSVLAERPDLMSFEDNENASIFNGTTGTCEQLWVMEYKSANESSRAILYPYVACSDDFINLYGMDLSSQERDLRVMTMDETDPNYGPAYGGRSISYVKYGADDVTDDDVDDPIVYNVVYKTYNMSGIRNAEVLLNRAEAYVQKYIEAGDATCAQRALDDLNNLRRARFATEGFVEKELADFADGQALLEFCYRERRRELCGEGNHRWFDLRRQGMPGFTHVYVDNSTGMETNYVLRDEDPRYVLPIPREVRLKNPQLEQNKY